MDHIFLAERISHAHAIRKQLLCNKHENLFCHVQHLLLSYFDIYVHVSFSIIVV